MAKVSLLDCTLRDGGYIVDWAFGRENIIRIAKGITDAGLDYVECGYLNSQVDDPEKAIFRSIEDVSTVIPKDRKNTIYLAMADVGQFFPSDITDFTNHSIDGIRVVFYKHQIEAALKLCKKIKECGYKLLVQPMVTVDYTKQEFSDLVIRIAELEPYSVAIVDSFGYMGKQEVRYYYQILDVLLSEQVCIGFHSHNNLQLAFITAQDILEYVTARHLIIDASLYGIGRGAGNLNTELIANYYNVALGYKYNIASLVDVISACILPIAQRYKWGYTPYYFLTAIYKCHPNFSAYLLDKHDVSLSEFKLFLESIPNDMRTKCKRDYVEELYMRLSKQS